MAFYPGDDVMYLLAQQSQEMGWPAAIVLIVLIAAVCFFLWLLSRD